MSQELKDRLQTIQARIDSAAIRCGRQPEEVSLVAVSKTHPIQALEEALAAGQFVFGENRLQEALEKIDRLGERAEFHLIGHLQRNKAARAVGRFSLIHTVDSVRLIDELERRAAQAGLVQRLLLQINVSGEASKSGATPEQLGELLDALDGSPHLDGQGLMTIPPFSDDPEVVRPHFARLRELLAGIGVHERFAPLHLSMGMSGDFEVAIEEGATLVRVGTAIFGHRDYAV